MSGLHSASEGPTGGHSSVARVMALVAQARPRCGTVRVVAVDGPAGSGKTTLAGGVAAALDCPVVRMDDLYAGWDGLAAAPGRLARLVLEPVSRGEQAAYRRWDWVADAWGDTVVVPVTATLVVDGCGSSVEPAGRYAAVRVWLDAPADLRRRRGVERDGASFATQWQRWADQEARLYAVDGTRDRADLVVTTG